MKGKLVVAVFVVAFLVLGTSQVIAQSELTLEGLAEQLTSLVSRVEALESIWEGPGSASLEDGGCLIANEELQRETAIKYYDQFEEFPESIDIKRVAFLPEENKVMIAYEEFWKDRWAWEYWENCEFIGSSDWVDE